MSVFRTIFKTYLDLKFERKADEVTEPCLLRELEETDLRHKDGSGVARVLDGAQHEASHDVAIRTHNFYRYVFSRLSSLHPATGAPYNQKTPLKGVIVQYCQAEPTRRMASQPGTMAMSNRITQPHTLTPKNLVHEFQQNLYAKESGLNHGNRPFLVDVDRVDLAHLAGGHEANLGRLPQSALGKSITRRAK